MKSTTFTLVPKFNLGTRYGSAVFSGVVLALTFPTWSLYPLAWVALVPLLCSAYKQTPRGHFARFFIAGWAFYAVLLQWLMTDVFWAGGWAFWGYQFLCVLLAFFWGLFGFAWGWMRGRLKWFGGAAALAVLWAAMELIDARLFTGFGWGELAYGQGKDLPLLQWAAIGGAPLVAAILVFVNALLALAIVEKGRIRWVRAAGVVLVPVAAHLIGAVTLGAPDYASKPLNVGILQPNFSLGMKWDADYQEEMVRNMVEKSRLMAEHERVDMFVWPESAITTEITTPGIMPMLQSLTQDTGAALYTGAERRNEKTGGYPNSSYFIDSQGRIVDYYDKVHLAPFGEYVPFSSYFPFIKAVAPPAIGDCEFGDVLKVFPVKGRRFGPLICFEVLFANMAEELRAKGADSIGVITNLAWFGDSNAIPEEIDIARLRAIETRLPLIHSANTGISGVFDPWGRFTLVNGFFPRPDRFALFSQDVTPSDTMSRRVGGVLPVAAPAARPVPYGPVIFPWAALAATAIMIIITAPGTRVILWWSRLRGARG